MKILDLFCGCGGLSLGFKCPGFSITGIDKNPRSGEIFLLNNIGTFKEKNLEKESITGDFDIIIGGPPCRPWSSINLKRRGIHHPDYKLLDSYFSHVFTIRPAAFLLENVPPISQDLSYKSLLLKAEKDGYSVSYCRINYLDYGIASQRKRLFTIGFRDFGIDASSFFYELGRNKEHPVTVGQAIRKYENTAMHEFPDHVWPNLKTIEKYSEYYKSGKYGWYKLRYEEPAPSFGNVMKTYILHPKAGIDNFPVRVLSVREILAIMGFPDSYSFPSDMPVNMKYQMVADSVSPKVARKMASVMRNLIKKQNFSRTG